MSEASNATAPEEQKAPRFKEMQRAVPQEIFDPTRAPILDLRDGKWLAASSLTGVTYIFPWPYGGGEAIVPAFGEVILSARWQDVPSFIAAERRGNIRVRETGDPVQPDAVPVPEHLLLEEDSYNRDAQTIALSAVWRPEFDAAILAERSEGPRSIMSRQFMRTTWLAFLKQILWREQHQRPKAREDVVARLTARIEAIETDNF